MDLKNFGAVLTFAADLEEGDLGFYRAALNSPSGAGLKVELNQIAATLEKNRKNLLRVRQENVTEMILEPIAGLSSEAFELSPGDPGFMSPEQVKAEARKIETRAVEFYQTAAEKIEALKEVSRAMKMVGKKRAANLKALQG